jgi:hypothetical protein
LKLIVRRILRERSESLKRLLLGRHGQTVRWELDLRKAGFCRTSKMSHAGSWRAACSITILFL